jgi:lipopolysaccharide/colanic/teichoic acid biosynthesis glycosyltransferase
MLAWDLEEVGAELVVDPVLTELAGPRLRVEPVDELPLVRLTQPTLGGASLLIKSAVDRTCAAVVLMVLAPLLLALAVAIRSSGSPVMQKQLRIGRGGKPFTLLRFRCEFATSHPMGAVLGRYALDELPQLFNVIGGSMSLVGPRPPAAGEHDARPFDIHRTYPIKPGLTGLRQVSGLSDPTSEESARLDLRYVQNWSLAQDAVILWKAARAGVRSASV